MSKKAQPDFAGISDAVPQSFKANGWIGKEIIYVKPSDLKANPLNVSLFKRENDDYFAKLSDDIQARGILVPLIAKRDNTLLAGHNRLEIAQKLGLKVVPVQYIDATLTIETEQEFVIKDNLLRRQLSIAERIELYRRLYPNFDERIMEENRGGDRKSEQRENGNSIAKTDATERIMPKLTAKQIAEDTGQKVTAVKQQISKHRKELSAEQSIEREYEEEQKLPKKIKSISHTFDVKSGKDRTNSKQNKITHAGCMRLLKECTKRVENVDDETLAQVYKKAVGLMKLLEKE